MLIRWASSLYATDPEKRHLIDTQVLADPEVAAGDPASQASVCSTSVVTTLRRELGDLEEVLRGNKNPGEEKTGLLDAGEALAKKLKQIGVATP